MSPSIFKRLCPQTSERAGGRGGARQGVRQIDIFIKIYYSLSKRHAQITERQEEAIFHMLERVVAIVNATPREMRGTTYFMLSLHWVSYKFPQGDVLWKKYA